MVQTYPKPSLDQGLPLVDQQNTSIKPETQTKLPRGQKIEEEMIKNIVAIDTINNLINNKNVNWQYKLFDGYS